MAKNNKTNREMLEEISTVLLGVPGTDDKGVVGDIKSLSTQMQGISRAVQTNTTWRKAFAWIIGIMITAIAVVITMVVT